MHGTTDDFRERELSVGRRWAAWLRARVPGAPTIQWDYFPLNETCQELSDSN